MKIRAGTTALRVLLAAGILSLLIAISGAVPAPVQGADGLDNFVYLPVIDKDYDPTWQFQAPIKVQLQPAPLSRPYLIVDSSGRPHLLWDTWSGSQAFIYHSYYTGTAWTAPTPIAQTFGRSKLLNPPVAGNHNDLYLVWQNDLNLGGPFRILYAAWDGARWGSEYELLGDGLSPNYINGMVRLDSTGTPNTAFINSDGISSSLYYQKWTGSQFSPRQPVPWPTYISQVWLDTNSGLRFFGDDFNGGVHYSYWLNGAFMVSNQTAPGRINQRQSLLDSQNTLHLIRAASVPVPGGNVTGLYHQCLKPDLSWSAEQVLSGQENLAGYTLSYNNLLQPILTWSKNNQTIQATFWNGCEPVRQKELLLPALPGGAVWGELLTVSQHTASGRVCFLSKQLYSTDTLWVTCTE